MTAQTTWTTAAAQMCYDLVFSLQRDQVFSIENPSQAFKKETPVI